MSRKAVLGSELRVGDAIFIQHRQPLGDEKVALLILDTILRIEPYRPEDDDSERLGIREAYFKSSFRWGIMLLFPDKWFYISTDEVENQISQPQKAVLLPKQLPVLIINQMGRVKRAFDFDTP